MRTRTMSESSHHSGKLDPLEQRTLLIWFVWHEFLSLVCFTFVSLCLFTSFVDSFNFTFCKQSLLKYQSALDKSVYS